MSIIITNVSADDVPLRNTNDYELRINKNLICSFTHDRQPDGLAQCLRDAADAVEAQQKITRAENKDLLLAVMHRLSKR